MTAKKVIIAGVLVVALAGYGWWYAISSRTMPMASASGTQPQTSSVVATTSPSSGSTPPASTPSTSSGVYADGTYTGSVANAFYGPLQLQIQIQAGKIAKITALQSPNGNAHTVQVNNMALPILNSEAITAQSAQVHVVSGATQTSEAFEESLSSALLQAQA